MHLRSGNQANQVNAPNVATDQTIARAARASDKPAKPYEVRAKTPVGLLLRVQPSGYRAYYVELGRARRVRIGPAGTLTLKQAEERAKAILLDPDHALRDKRAAFWVLEDYLDQRYAPHACAKLKNGERAVTRVKSAWKPLLKRRIDQITSAVVDRIRDTRVNSGISAATVNRDVAALSGVLTHWKESSNVKAHPLSGLKQLRVSDDEKIRYLSTEESARLRAALRDRDDLARSKRESANAWRVERGYPLYEAVGKYSDHITPLVLLSLNTGMRRGELFSLCWESLDLVRRTISVIASNSKGNTTRHLPMNDEVLDVLQNIRPPHPEGLVFKSPSTGKRLNNVASAWDSVTASAQIKGFRWHDMRHDFASRLVMAGVSLFTVQKLLGHSNSRMTQRYAHLAPSALVEAVMTLQRR